MPTGQIESMYKEVDHFACIMMFTRFIDRKITIMTSNPPTEEDPSLFARHIDELRVELRNADALKLAECTASDYTDFDGKLGEFRLPFWGEEIRLSYPDFIAVDPETDRALPIAHQALILYYFRTADETLPSRTWIAFSELPDGRFYDPAFQGYTGRALAQIFKDDVGAFEQAASRLDSVSKPPGSQIPGDAVFGFQILPKVSLLVVFWQGDEDFPSAFQILFDASTSHFLPTDVCAIMGSMLTRKLIKAKTSAT